MKVESLNVVEHIYRINNILKSLLVFFNSPILCLKYVKKLPPSDILLVGKKFDKITKITAKTRTLTGFLLNEIS